MVGRVAVWRAETRDLWRRQQKLASFHLGPADWTMQWKYSEDSKRAMPRVHQL